MPKLISELAQGRSASQSQEGGAEEYTRSWKVILNSPDERFDASSAIGVYVGANYSDTIQVPCRQVEVRNDGESRLVLIVTASYGLSATDGGGGGGGGGSEPPDLRPATFSTSTSLIELPSRYYYPDQADNTRKNLIVNSVGDMLDGVSHFESVTSIRITQSEQEPGTRHSKWCGYINVFELRLGSTSLVCAPRTVLFKGVETSPIVESFGGDTFRMFTNAYEFLYKPQGWDVVVVDSGFNVIAFAPNLAQNDNDNFAVPLKRDEDTNKIATPLALADGVAVGQKVRAHVLVSGPGVGAYQNPSAAPVALNSDGTPRSRDKQPRVISFRVQPEADLVAILNLRVNA